MSPVWHDIWTGLTTASPLDQLNLVLGIAGVGLMIRRNLWAFPVGLVAVVVQGVLFYRARYYADAAVQVFFFGALVYGWWHWTHPDGHHAAELPVTRLSARGRWMGLALTGAGTVGWAVVLRERTDAVMPFRDAFIAAFSVAAQVLQSRKQIENWPVWVAVNVTAIGAYWAGGLYYTAMLYAVYLGLSLVGWRAWRTALRTGAPA